MASNQRKPWDVVPQSYWVMIMGAYARQLDKEVLETGRAIPYFEERYEDARGKPHTLLTTKVPLRDSDDRVSRVATIALDISERKKTEKTLQESQRNLVHADA